MRTHIILIVALMITAATTYAQPMDRMHDARNDTGLKKPMKYDHMEMEGIPSDTAKHKMGMMTSQFSLDLPMNRDGSGTSWAPDRTPMYMYMIHGNKWMHMIHGSFFPRYNKQDLFNKGNRGDGQFDVPDWLMYMAQRKIGKNGLFSANTMFSFDPFLVGAGGYPLLYQTGESYKGKSLVDRQHPHDLFSELSVAYTQRVAKYTDISLSAGYPGEPALGPPAFMHRISAMNNPDAPLSHHYADATHITFGTATLGFRYKNVKIEGSLFTGREPDEFRYNFDKPRFDSYSMRLSVNPSKEWALQVSHGWLKNPEEADSHDNVRRFTASAINTKTLGDNSYVATTLVYGQNYYHGKTQPSILLENSFQLNKTAIYGRFEYVVKDATELDVATLYPRDQNFKINALTLGVNRILTTYKKTSVSIGAQATVNASPSGLTTLYSNTPVGFQVYMHITPAIVKVGSSPKMSKIMDM